VDGEPEPRTVELPVVVNIDAYDALSDAEKEALGRFPLTRRWITIWRRLRASCWAAGIPCWKKKAVGKKFMFSPEVRRVQSQAAETLHVKLGIKRHGSQGSLAQEPVRSGYQKHSKKKRASN